MLGDMMSVQILNILTRSFPFGNSVHIKYMRCNYTTVLPIKNMSSKFLQCGTHFCSVVETISQSSTPMPQASLAKFNGSEFGDSH